MKKSIATILSIMITISLTACGSQDSSKEDTTIVPENQQTAEVSAELTEEEKSKAAEDFAQLQTFLQGIIDNYTLQQEIAGMIEKLKSGEMEESTVLDAYKRLADDSQQLLQNLEHAKWKTNYYNDKVAAFTDCVTVLSAYTKTIYEASAENDEKKLAAATELAAKYDEKLGTFLDIMDVD